MTPLLDLDQCRERLDERFSELAAQHPTYFAQCIPRNSPPDQMKRLSAAVTELTGLPCPPGLVALAQAWNLGGLEVANFQFLGDSFGDELLRVNQESKAPRWWEDAASERPGSLLMVAQADPHALLVDVRNGAVLAFDIEAGSGSRIKVADDISLFVRAAITLSLADRAALESFDPKLFARELGDDCSAGFWLAQQEGLLCAASTEKPQST